VSAAGTTEIRHVVVAGLMGAGKTSVGTAIGARLGWPVRDSDATLLATTGRTAREIRAELGTDGLHRAEAQALLDALATNESDVICAAASVIEDPAARAGLVRDDVVVIWLRASPATLAQRFASDDEHRPIYGPDPLEVARARAARRDPLYAALARITIDVDESGIVAVTEAALTGLAGLGGLPVFRDQ
jgi:shikimate kinase